MELKNLLDDFVGQRGHHAELIDTLNQHLIDYKRCDFNIRNFQRDQICDTFSRLLKLLREIIGRNKCSKAAEGLQLKTDELRNAYEDFIVDTDPCKACQRRRRRNLRIVRQVRESLSSNSRASRENFA